MICVASSRVLAVGCEAVSKSLGGLGIRLLAARDGTSAIGHLRRFRDIQVMVSAWDLVDMPKGQFIRRVRSARPWLPTIVLLDETDEDCEAAARSLGAAAVLCGQSIRLLLREVVEGILGAKTPVPM